MILYYIEVSEVHVSSFTMHAANEDEARTRALQLAKDKETDCYVYDREATVVEHPAEKQIA